MTESPIPAPTLFRPEGTPELPDHPALLGGRCQACGYVFLPMQTYGCERCGSLALEEAALTGKGRLIASAEVHMPPGPHRAAPFTVGSIATVDGAIIRSLLDTPPGTRLEPGAEMVTCLVPETRPGRGPLDLRFTLAKEA